MLSGVEAAGKTVVLGIPIPRGYILAHRIVSPPYFGSQVVDTAIVVPSLSPGKLVCTPNKEGRGTIDIALACPRNFDIL